MEINHKYTDEIVCPYCGNKSDNECDLYHLRFFNDYIICQKCEQNFNLKISYTTEKIK